MRITEHVFFFKLIDSIKLFFLNWLHTAQHLANSVKAQLKKHPVQSLFKQDIVELLKNLPQQKYQEDGVGPVWFSDAREATGAKSGANVYVGRPNVQLTKSA